MKIARLSNASDGFLRGICVAPSLFRYEPQYLADTENYPAAMHPDLILLDLNIPRLDGLSLLTLIKLFPHYRSTPIIVLTTSSWSRDIERAYQLGALKYFIKPTNCEDHIALGAAIAAVWDQRFAKSKGADGQISH